MGGVALRFCHPLGLNPAGVSLFRMMPPRAILRGFEACFAACSHLLLVVALAV